MKRSIGILSAFAVLVLLLAGCGGSNTGGATTATDQFAKESTSPATSLPTDSGVASSYKLTLSATGADGVSTSVGPLATVIATAEMSDLEGNRISGQEILFEKVDPAAPLNIPTDRVTTDSTGKALNFLRAASLPVTSSSSYDVVIKATATKEGRSVTAVSIIKVVRSAGNVISFTTTKSPTDPDGTLNRLEAVLKQVNPADHPTYGIVQLVPFQVLDRDGVPIPRHSVTVGIYSAMGGSGCTAFIDSPEMPAEKTVTTDDNGKGIFNAAVVMDTPPIGSHNSCSVIYKATTTIGNLNGVFSYGGFVASLKNERD